MFKVSDYLRSLCAFAMIFATACWALDLFALFRLNIYNEQYMSAMLGLALATTWLRRQDGSSVSKVGAAVVAAALSIAVCCYLAYFYPTLIATMIIDPLPSIVIGTLLVPLLAVALWRAAGVALFVIVVAALLIGVTAHWLPGHLAGRQVAPDRLISYLALDPNGILGLPLLVTSTVVVAFVVFGAVLNAAGGGNFFTDLSLTAMGRFRGSTAKIAVLASALFGSVSGSAVANVVSTGVITIPMMKRTGYSPEDASAIEATASTGGQLLPPVMGAVAFLMAEFLNLPYSTIAVAALIPGLLYYFCLFLQVDLLASRDGIHGLSATELPKLRRVIRGGGAYLLPFAILVYLLFAQGYEAERAVAFSTGLTLLIWLWQGYGGERFSGTTLLKALIAAGIGVADIIVIGASAGIIIGSLNISAVSFGLTLQLVSIGENSLFLLLLTSALLSIILGMGLPTLGVYLLLATLIAPSMVELGLQPLGAHMFIFFFGMMSLITPPIAVAAFAAANIGQAHPLKVGLSAMRFAWPAFVLPFLFVYSPTLLMEGEGPLIVLSSLTAVIGIAAICVAIIGFWKQRLHVPDWIALLTGGAALLMPSDVMEYGVWVNLVGAIVVVLIWARHRKAGAATSVAMVSEGGRD